MKSLAALLDSVDVSYLWGFDHKADFIELFYRDGARVRFEWGETTPEIGEIVGALCARWDARCPQFEVGDRVCLDVGSSELNALGILDLDEEGGPCDWDRYKDMITFTVSEARGSIVKLKDGPWISSESLTIENEIELPRFAKFDGYG